MDGRHRDPGAVLPWLSAPDRAGPPPAMPRLPATTPRARPDRAAGLGIRGVVALLAGAALLLALGAVAAHGVTGGSRVSTPFLSYTAPAGWTAAPPEVGGRDPTVLQGAVHGPGYACAGQALVRGFAAAALLPTDPAQVAGSAERAERLARWFAGSAYATPDGSAPEVTVLPPRPLRVDGPDGPVEAAVSEVTVRTAVRGDCPPATGTVLALGAPVGGGAALLLVAGDTGGGPADPPPVDRAALDAVLASVRLGPGPPPS